MLIILHKYEGQSSVHPLNYPDWHFKDDKLFKRVKQMFALLAAPNDLWREIVPKPKPHFVMHLYRVTLAATRRTYHPVVDH